MNGISLWRRTSLLSAALWSLAAHVQSAPPESPNILLILADDLGYGDVRCYNPESKVATPHLDRLADEGTRFTDAHSPATVCTPTRYSILTGRLCFRTGNGGVFTGVGGPNLIEADRLTLASMLRETGYTTAMIGKWHIGLSFQDAAGQAIVRNGIEAVRRVDFSRPILDAPVHRGFDHFFGTACCPTTDWLYAYIQDDRVPVPPSLSIIRDREKLPDHPYSMDCRGGFLAPDFDLEQVDLVFLEKSRAFLRENAERRPDQPFFLFHSMQAVHLPSFPAPRFHGKSGAGPHGDFIHQLDWMVGQLMEELEALDFAENTLVIFASDNGPEIQSVHHMRTDHGHDGARPWRGMKRDAFEGGHRTPFLVRWPGRIPAGTVNEALLSLSDLLATCAAIVGYALPDDAGEDSFNLLASWKGEAESPARPYLIQQTMSGRHLSLRRGPWKYLDHKGSGGNDYLKREWLRPYWIADTDPDAPGQLYDLSSDPGETTNLYSEKPEIVAELKALLDQAVESGRTAPTR